MIGKSNRFRDGVLILGVLVLVALAFIPEGKDRAAGDPSSPHTTQPASTDDADSEHGDLIYKAKKAVDKTNRYYSDLENKVKRSDVFKTGAEAKAPGKLFNRISPAMQVPHRFLPLIPESKWVYWVSGHEDLVSEQKWTMEVVTAPDEKGQGVLEVGFEDHRSRADVWLANGSIKIDGLPFVEPERFLGNRSEKVIGEFLPLADRIIDDAVWIHQYQREAIYDYYNRKGRPVKALATVLQKDRAKASGLEKILTRAGTFQALRVLWLSRVEITVKGRPVLEKLTTEPYRKEIMWLAPGYGIVRREIEYIGDETKKVTFDLVDYSRPRP
jgi:hypothetical protein